MKQRGFSLLETMIAFGILAGLAVVCCNVLVFSSATFRLGTQRTSLQSELRRVLAPLRRDLLNTTYQSASLLSEQVDTPERPGSSGGTLRVHRDALCFSAIAEGEDVVYNSRGQAPWSSYLLYFATLDQPEGSLVRMRLGNSSHSDHPLVLHVGDLSSENSAIVRRDIRSLSTRILEFSVDLDPSNQQINFRLRLRGPQGRIEGTGRSTAELLEVHEAVRPVNTWPKL